MNKSAQRAIKMSRNSGQIARNNFQRTQANVQRSRDSMQPTTAYGAYHTGRKTSSRSLQTRSGLGLAAIGTGVGALIGGPIGAGIGAALGWIIGKKN